MRSRTIVLLLLGILMLGAVPSSQADTAQRRSIEILCARDGTTVQRAIGDAGPKGVTVRFRHPQGQWSFSYESPKGGLASWTSWGDAMVAELHLPIPPGPARVRCWSGHDPQADVKDLRWWVDVHVHDAQGLWRSPRLECSGMIVGTVWEGGGRRPAQEREMVREAFRQVELDIGPDDELVLLGYPRQHPRLWGAVRDGRLIGEVRMMKPVPDGTVTPSSISACSDR